MTRDYQLTLGLILNLIGAALVGFSGTQYTRLRQAGVLRAAFRRDRAAAAA